MPKAVKKLSMWFDWPDDPHGGRVEIVHLDQQDTANIAEQVYETRNVFNAGTDKIDTEQRINTILDRRLTADRAIKSWENFLDGEGKPMECTRENKFFWADDAEFMAKLNGLRKIVAGKVREVEERTEKN